MNTLILCNGKPPDETLFRQSTQWADLFIAADGGGNAARRLGTLPDIVIGDLDSFEPQPEESFEIIEKPSQYANDLEKALTLAHQKKADRVKVLGATGLRLDHTMKNLSVLAQFDDQFEQLTFEDTFGTMFLLSPAFSKSIPVGSSISLIPLSGRVTGVTTQGLKYPLENGFLENGVQDGSSNTVVSTPVEILHDQGHLLLFIAK